MAQANDPQLTSWINVPSGSDFPIQNIPFGIFSCSNKAPRPCTRIGDTVIDLRALAERSHIQSVDIEVLQQTVLNPLFALGRKKVGNLRHELAELFSAGNTTIQNNEQPFLHDVAEVTMHLPVRVENYTDFYSSEEHATNVGTMFRGKDNALMPNWKHIPVGYHGRASSIIASGTPVRRPNGQQLPKDAEAPVFGPSKLLDFELEMAFITCGENALGDPISMEQAEDHIIGMVLFNDWSARDIQKWEYVPLGPFLGKSFGSSVSPWVVTLDALEPFRVAGPKQEPAVLPYLAFEGAKNFDIRLSVAIQPDGSEEKVVCRSNHKYLYWNIAQQLVHHTINGCNIKTGDMYASGTISGPDESAFGSMLELTWRGTKPIAMPDGSERKFIHDGDTVIMRGHCEKDGVRIGFGEVRSQVLPAHKL